MTRIRVAVTIPAHPDEVWADVSQIASHVEWMADAVAIRFLHGQTSGVGTVFDCDTRFGPLRLTDRMEITEWREGQAMGIRHVGLVRGEGRFELHRTDDANTRFVWDESLRFPWWMAGRLGGTMAKPVLTAVWRGNLRRLQARFAR